MDPAEAMASPLDWSVFANQGRWKPYPHLVRLGWDVYRLCTYPKFNRLLVVEPPRHGKSYFISRNTPTWYLKRNPDDWVISAGYGDQLTRRWGRAVRNQLDEYSWMDGIRSDPRHRAADNWGVEGREGGMMAVGTGGGITGYGAKLFLMDDPIKGHEAAGSITQRDKLWEWWVSDARSRMEPGGKILLIQTRWHEDDFAGRILKEMEVGGEHWHVHHMAALSDEHGKPLICTESNVGEGVALCPERYSVDDLWKIRKEIGAYHFNCLYQGCPTHAPGQFWDPVLFNESIWVDSIPATQTRYCVIANDPSLGKDQKRADYNAVVALSTSDADLIYVDCEMERCGAYGSIEMMSRLIDRLPQKPHVIAVESVAFQSVLCDILRPALQNSGIPRGSLASTPPLICCTRSSATVSWSKNSGRVSPIWEGVLCTQ